jgi:hypothetical protein
MLVDARQGAASSAAELEEWLSRDPMPESYDGGRIPDEMRRFFHDPSSGILRITDVDGVTVYHMSPATFARAELPADFVSEGLDIVYEFAGGVPSAIDIVAIADLSSLVASVREVSDFFPGGARTFSLSNGRAYLSNYAMCAYPSRDRLLTALASLNDPDTAELLNIWRESALAEHQMAPIQCEAFVPPFVEQDRSYRVNVYTPDAVPLPDTDYSRDVRSVDLINLAEMQEALAD